jgi:hypothetical protein
VNTTNRAILLLSIVLTACDREHKADSRLVTPNKVWYTRQSDIPDKWLRETWSDLAKPDSLKSSFVFRKERLSVRIGGRDCVIAFADLGSGVSVVFACIFEKPVGSGSRKLMAMQKQGVHGLFSEFKPSIKHGDILSIRVTDNLRQPPQKKIYLVPLGGLKW